MHTLKVLSDFPKVFVTALAEIGIDGKFRHKERNLTYQVSQAEQAIEKHSHPSS
jgi:hypothetical protein